MESAIYQGFKNFIPSINRLLCERHLCQTGSFYEFGLTDAFNKEDFEVKLASLQEKWNSLCPYFFGWFNKKQSDFFVESVIQSAREGSDVCRLYYQNNIESLHHVEKMNQNFKKKTVTEAIGNIQKLIDRQDSEEVRALYRAGSYVLSTSYKQFFVPSATWHNWTVEQKKDHVQKFRNYKPNVSDNFKKPKNVGQKSNYAKRIRTSPDPDIVMDRLEEVSASTNNSSSQPIIIAESSQVVKESASQPNIIADSSQVQHNIGFQDPRVSPPKEFVLFLHKHLPKNITKCQGRCGKSIDNEDKMIICSYGTSTWINKVTGRENSKYGPMYLKFNERCLRNFDDENYYSLGQAFNYSVVTINPKSKGDLNPTKIYLSRKLEILLHFS